MKKNKIVFLRRKSEGMGMILKNKFLLLVIFSVIFSFALTSRASATTLYYDDSYGTDWNILGNWWTDSGFTAAATNLPTASDDVIITGNVFSNSGPDVTVKTLTVNGHVNVSDFSIVVTNGAVFNGTAYNGANITGDVVFNAGSRMAGGSVSGIAKFSSATGGVMTVPDGGAWGYGTTGSIVGADNNPITAWVFNGESVNYGDIDNHPIFNGMSNNSGNIHSDATFNGASYNIGTIWGKAIFANATGGVMTVPDGGTWGGGMVDSNVGIDDNPIISWVFNGNSANQSIIDNVPVFNDTSYNNGTVTGDAVFNDAAYNDGAVTGKAKFSTALGGLITISGNGVWGSGTADSNIGNDEQVIDKWIFNGNSRNKGVVGNNSEFNGESSNDGTVNGDAIFNDSSMNSGDGTVAGNATFKDKSSNWKIVTGNATFVGPLSMDEGTVGGLRKRIFFADINITMNFKEGGPWIVIADGAKVNRYFSRFNDTTTFQTLHGGIFDDSIIPFPGSVEYIASSNDFRSGGAAMGWNADDNHWSYDLPFSFNFFGNTYTKVFVSSNGYLGFNEKGDMNTSLFKISEGNGSPIIAAMGTDLITNDVYVTNIGDGKVVFRWQANEYAYPDSGQAVNFEITLNDNSTFQLDYGDQSAALSRNAAVGVNDGNGMFFYSRYDDTDLFNRLNSSVWNEPKNSGPVAEKFQQDILSGFLSVDGSNPTSTAKVTFNTQYTITSGDVKIVFPAGTEMTKTDGGNFDLSTMTAQDITDALKSSNPGNIAGAISIGIPNLKLSFSKDITVTIPVDSSYDNQTLDIWYQNAGETSWTKGPSCSVSAGLCVFQTNHATTYSAGGEPSIGTVAVVPIQTPEQAKVDSWSAYLFPSSAKCATKLRLDIQGKHFTHDTQVKIGGKSAASVNKKSSKEISATFCLTKLLNIQTDLSRKITVTNPGAGSTKAKSKINLETIFSKFTEADFNTFTKVGITNIQQALVKLELLTLADVTGFYNQATTAAIGDFQAQNKLPVTGSVGPLTKTKLVEKYQREL